MATSTLSHTTSTHPMLSIDPPNIPFAPSGSNSPVSRTGSPLVKNGVTDSSSVSLSVNYLPHKFSNSLLSAGPRKRRGKNGDPNMPKLGGGIDAFRSGEARMPGQDDDDYDGVSGAFFSSHQKQPTKLRWNRFKWILFIANTIVSSLLLLYHARR